MRLFDRIRQRVAAKEDVDVYERERPTSVIVHMDGDVSCTMVAADEQARSMLRDAAMLHPAIQIMNDDGKTLTAAFPWSWLRIKLPLNGNLVNAEESSDNNT